MNTVYITNLIIIPSLNLRNVFSKIKVIVKRYF